MPHLLRKVELLANIAIIGVSLLLGYVLIQRFILPPSPSDESGGSESVKVGERISLSGVDWSQRNAHLVLVLQEGCRFCTESAPFYQRIVRETAGRGDFQLIAVLPQEASEGKEYLSAIGISVSEVKQASPSSLGVRGTPTLLLVNNEGAVTNVWRGKLPTEKESEVLGAVLNLVGSQE